MYLHSLNNEEGGGRSTGSWIVKYHRPIGKLLTTPAHAGLRIDTVCEPLSQE